MKTKRIKKSSIKLPEKERSQVLAVNHREKDMSASIGWIRNQWDACDVPKCLVTIIGDYYINEVIHLFTNKGGVHYKIDAFDIINDF